MERYVLHSYFHVIDMDNVDTFLGYPWMESIVIVNIDMQKNNLKRLYNINKIALHDISLINKKIHKFTSRKRSTKRRKIKKKLRRYIKQKNHML